jgi:hypothetical protein
MIATDLLPRIAGGEWRRTHHGFPCTVRMCYFGKPTSDYDMISTLHRELFDHGRFFRRKGAKGPFTWKIGIATGEPYGLADEVKSGQPFSVSPMLRERGLVAIAHPDLSPWYPGWTALFVVGQSLNLEAAAALGFRICSTVTERETVA